MRYAKLAVLILGAMAILSLGIAGIAGFLLAREKTKQLQEAEDFFAPRIVLPNISCELSEDASSQSFSVTIKSADVGKTSDAIQGILSRRGGEVESLSDRNYYASSDTYYPSGNTFKLRYINLHLLLPLAEFEGFRDDLKKIQPGPLVFENEQQLNNNAILLKQQCRASIRALQGLQEEERLYLGQLRGAENSGENLVNKIVGVRQKASTDEQHLNNDLVKLLNKVDISITVEEFAG